MFGNILMLSTIASMALAQTTTTTTLKLAHNTTTTTLHPAQTTTTTTLSRAHTPMTTSLFLNSPPSMTLAAWDASVINVDSTATTYALECLTNCGDYPHGMLTVTEGPNFYGVAVETSFAGISWTASESCSLAGTTSAVCVVSATEAFKHALKHHFTTTAVMTETISPLIYHPVTITAGVEKLPAAATATFVTSPQDSDDEVENVVVYECANAASGSLAGRSGEMLALALLPTFAAVVGALLIVA